MRTLLYDENDSISFLLPFPAGQPRTGPALHFAGCLHALSEMGASGLPLWNTSQRKPGCCMSDAPELTCRNPRLRKRDGRCYELSFVGCREAPEWTLIHGEVIGPGGIGRMGHAWLELNGWVYDPVLDCAKTTDDYADVFCAFVFKRYTFMEANAEVCKTGHFGPW